MAKAANVTITAKAGPGLQATSLALTGVTAVEFRISDDTIRVYHGGQPNPATFDYEAVATVTYVISGVTATITVS